MRRRMPAAVALLATLVVAATSSAAGRTDAGVRFDPPGRVVAGQSFPLEVIVDSLPLGEGPSFDFTLTLAAPPGLRVLAWRSIVAAPACTATSIGARCTSRVIGGDIHSTNIQFTMRAAQAGSYAVDAAVEVAGGDSEPANNRAQIEVAVAPSSPRGLTRRGTARNDVLRGTAGNDRLYGLGGADTLRGLAGNDVLDGGTGNDRLFGDAGNDRLVGGAGYDVLDSRDGRAETVDCGPGRDSARADRADRLRRCEVVRR